MGIINESTSLSFIHFSLFNKLGLGAAFNYLNDKIRGVVSAHLNPLKTDPQHTEKRRTKITVSQNAAIPKGKPVFVFGDIHGELHGLKENLLNAGLIDSEGKWVGQSCTMVQMGDVIDRGALSEEAWDYLKELQMQAEKTCAGTVMRLIGNHELMVLQGDFHYASRVIKNPAKFAEKVKAEILKGTVRLAYTDGKRLYTHAGMRSKIREQMINEIKEKQSDANRQISTVDIVDHLNSLFVKAVESNDYTHAIFQVGQARGGNHSYGGVLWEDVSEMLKSRRARDIPQVIGHNPPRHRGEPPIRITAPQRLVNVDAGLNPLYGGHQAYVVFEDSDIIIRNKEAGIWMQTKTKDLLQGTKNVRVHGVSRSASERA